MPAEVQHMTIHELRGLLRTRTISALDLVRAVYARIDATAETTNTFISLCREDSERAARAADQRIAAGRAGPLTGIPIAVKDNICMSVLVPSFSELRSNAALCWAPTRFLPVIMTLIIKRQLRCAG